MMKAGQTSIQATELRQRVEAGEYPPGPMGPKVEAVCDFVLSTSGTAHRGAE